MPAEIETEKPDIKLSEQDKSLSPLPNEIDVRHSQDALDALATARTKEKETEVDEPVIEPKSDATPAPDDEAAKKAAEEKAAAEKVAADKKTSDDAALAASADIFKDLPQLPQGASPKSAEAFSSIKIRAAQEISTLTQDREKLRQEVEELKKRVDSNKPLTPEIEREIEELRKFRTKLDVEADPKFKEFNKQVASSQEFIYAQLRKSSVVTDAVIDEIKKHGGPEMVNLEKLFEKIADPTTKRLVEAKIADIEQAKWARQEAIKSAKENIDGYVKEREKAAEQSALAHRDATKVELDKLRSEHPGLAWLKPRAVDPKADEATRKAIAEQNEFSAGIQKQLEQAMQDDSPQMRAIQMAGMAQLLLLQRVHEGSRAAHEAAVKELEAEKKAHAETRSKLDAIKNASVSRLRESGAPPSGKLPEGKINGLDVRPSGDALDAAARQVMEEKQARGK